MQLFVCFIPDTECVAAAVAVAVLGVAVAAASCCCCARLFVCSLLFCLFDALLLHLDFDCFVCVVVLSQFLSLTGVFGSLLAFSVVVPSTVVDVDVVVA